MNLDKSLKDRIRELITLAWEIFSKKVGNEVIIVNKEASMQLQYAYILQQLLPMIIINKNEKVYLDLETTINDGIKNREVDIFINGNDNNENFKIAIELKCYRKVASSGRNRGATDIFMKNVYEDLFLLEKYCENSGVDIGVALVMNDNNNFVNPKNKKTKCWDYDISQDAEIKGGKTLNTPIGGKAIDIRLEKNYKFKWKNVGDYWFAELEGH